MNNEDTTAAGLLPCPFCGSDQIDPKGWRSFDATGPACDDCGASAGSIEGLDNIAAWNLRSAGSVVDREALDIVRKVAERERRIADGMSVCDDWKKHHYAEQVAEEITEALSSASQPQPAAGEDYTVSGKVYEAAIKGRRDFRNAYREQRDMLTADEWNVVHALGTEQELTDSAVLRQALRLYQLQHARLKNGETVTWSGDAQRARDFAGPLALATAERSAPASDGRAVALLAKHGIEPDWLRDGTDKPPVYDDALIAAMLEFAATPAPQGGGGDYARGVEDAARIVEGYRQNGPSNWRTMVEKVRALTTAPDAPASTEPVQELHELASTVDVGERIKELEEALHVAEVTMRLDGERMRQRGMTTSQNEAGLLTARAALRQKQEEL